MDRREQAAPSDDTSGQSPALQAPSISFTRRRLALLVAGLFVLWLVGVFARQVGEAASAADQADQMKLRNAAMRDDVASLDRELTLIRQPAFTSQMARAYLLGTAREIPFTIDPKAPALPANAPGSVGIKPSVQSQQTSPLDSWLQALFGSQ